MGATGKSGRWLWFGDVFLISSSWLWLPQSGRATAMEEGTIDQLIPTTFLSFRLFVVICWLRKRGRCQSTTKTAAIPLVYLQSISAGGQCYSRAVSEQFQSNFKDTFGKINEKFQSSLRAVSEQSQSSSGAVSEQFWSSSGVISEQFQSSTGAIPEQFQRHLW